MSDNYKVARSDDGLGGVCQPYQDWLTVSGQFLLARPPVYKTYRADVSIRFNSASLTDGQRERESGPVAHRIYNLLIKFSQLTPWEQQTGRECLIYFPTYNTNFTNNFSFSPILY